MMRIPDAQPVSEVSLATEEWQREAMASQIRDAVGRLTYGHQSVRTCLDGGVHPNALRAALTEIGRDADAEMKAATEAMK